MDGKAGLGETGETILIGQDRLLRNDSSLTEENDILSARYQSDALNKVFDGVDTVGTEHAYRDMASLFAATPFSFGGKDFAIVALQNKDEALAAIGFLSMVMAAVGLFVAALVAVGAWAFSRTITGPMAKISETMGRISENELDLVVENTARATKLARWRAQWKYLGIMPKKNRSTRCRGTRTGRRFGSAQ